MATYESDQNTVYNQANTKDLDKVISTIETRAPYTALSSKYTSVKLASIDIHIFEHRLQNLS